MLLAWRVTDCALAGIPLAAIHLSTDPVILNSASRLLIEIRGLVRELVIGLLCTWTCTINNIT
jgi:hypothetical protein